MKRIFLLLLVLPVLAGCNLKNDPILQSRGFAHTGCSSGLATRAGSDDGEPSLLTLKYEDGNLRVTRTNATMNCAIKFGIDCDVSIEGDVIHYWVHEKDGPTANCICRVDRMSSLVSGLQPGKEYTFDYRCSMTGCPSFTFVFNDRLILIKDL